MADVSDILLDSNFDVAEKNGDFIIGDATNQHQAVLLAAGKGEMKQNPTVGVGIEAFLLDEDTGLLLREIRSQFSKDGMTVESVGISNNQLDIKAQYE